jgi:hypothetical protein
MREEWPYRRPYYYIIQGMNQRLYAIDWVGPSPSHNPEGGVGSRENTISGYWPIRLVGLRATAERSVRSEN